MKVGMLPGRAMAKPGTRVRQLDRAAGATARNTSGKFIKRERKAAWAKASGKCEACGTVVEFNAGDHGFHLDHIVPLADGGADDQDNKQVLCMLCHIRKTAEENSVRFGGAAKQ